MMQYKDFRLTSIDQLGNALKPVNVQYPPAGTVDFGIGERIELEIVIENTIANFQDDETYMFNIALWHDQPRRYSPNLGIGWKIYLYDNAGTIEALTSLVCQGSEAVQNNFELYVAPLTTPNTIVLRFRFYATMDISDWITTNFINNESRWQKDREQANFVSLTGATVYTGAKFLETSFYKCDNLSLQPSSLADFARDTNNGNAPTYAVKMAGKFYDRGIGGAQAWVSGALTNENLERFTISNVSPAITITDYRRKASPFLSANVDLNFNQIAANIPSTGYVYTSGVNALDIRIKTPNFSNVDNIVLRLIDVTKNQFSNIVDFYLDYKADSITIAVPTADLTPSPNWLPSDNNTFGTPLNVLFAAPSQQLEFNGRIDGSKFQLGHFYRIIAVLYDSATGDFSTHISPQFIAIEAPQNFSNVKGNIYTYNESFTGNEVTVSSLERYRCELDILGSSWSGGLSAFLANIRAVSFKKYRITTGGQSVVEQGRYDFVQGQSVGQTPIVYTNSSPSFLFHADFRAELNASVLQNYKVIWEIEMNDNGTINVFTFEQRIKVRPFDGVRINGLRVLNYQEFLASNIVPITYACRDDDFVIIEVEKNGAPDAYLQALFVFLDNNSNLISVQEEESYTGAFLPTQSSPILSQVDSNFGDNFAYYRLQISALPTGLSNSFFGALIENI